LVDIERWRGRGDRVALATVVAARRSAPRPVGAKLAISSSGELAGSVSGGCVEHEVYEEAKEILASGGSKLLTYGITDDQAWKVGLPCGGEIDVLVSELDDELVGQAREIYTKEGRAALLTNLDDAATSLVAEGEHAEIDELIRDGRNTIVER
jgi:xanthine/CO dehydrogenase XdhC/CoxF family maturation factor